jgi:hypothetical protein
VAALGNIAPNIGSIVALEKTPERQGNIAPNIGSIVALEKTPERQPSQVLPTFLTLNSDSGIGSGYLDSKIRAIQVQSERGRSVPESLRGGSIPSARTRFAGTESGKKPP